MADGDGIGMGGRPNWKGTECDSYHLVMSIRRLERTKEFTWQRRKKYKMEGERYRVGCRWGLKTSCSLTTRLSPTKFN
jgi:hypothetical protein